jgi:mRNA deadenylase 3'-5' endonuclease subunit Ccr4
VEPWTTYKERATVVLRAIDYIWYTPEFLTVTKLLEIPEYHEFPNKLPCDVYPGDHLAILSEFQFE